VLPGNTADNTTLRDFLARIERQYGKARRIWLMDRGIPTEVVLAEMRGANPPVQYLVGTPKGRLTRLEKDLLAKPWQQARPGVRVKLLPRDGELYVFADSANRVAKERAMRRRRLKWLWARLKQLSMMTLGREELRMKLGAARAHAPAAWRLVVIALAPEGVTFTYHLDRNRLRRARRREGRYLLRTNLTEDDPAKLWNLYLLLVRVEEAFKNLKSLPLRKQGATSPSGRSSIKTRPGSKRISSSPSWPIACTPLWRDGCMHWRRGSPRAASSRSSRRCR
jgi:hypothetical protein